MRHAHATFAHINRQRGVTVSRARATDVLATLDRLLSADVQRASGPNGQLSRAEQAQAPAHVAAAAAELRAAAAPGARIKDDALSAHLSGQARAVVAANNQSSGVGRAFFSRAEARAASADPRLGTHVQKAWAIAAGQRADVDGIAEARARAAVSEGGLFKLFGSEAAALSYQDPHGRSVTWLVRSSEASDRSSFVWGRNDLWAERFDVDATSGAVTVTGEH